MEMSHLRGFRQRAVMSQEQLAQKSGVARDTISKLEMGHRKAYPTTIRKLAAGLEVEPQMLLGGVEYLDEQPPEDTSPEQSDQIQSKKVGF
ncbi:MAG: helix-turn-helix transcriptional regulator [Rubrobacter sp.]|nr:helix-turn-helix transcriptional regulator [Rubrobacter sp.]